MSFNRIKYDKCAYDLQMNRSVAPGDYRIYAPYAESCEPCFSDGGPVGSKSDVSLVKKSTDLCFKDMAQTESELSWRNQLLTKCNDNNQVLDSSKLEHKPSCSNKLTSEDTRFTNPIDNYRGMSLTSYMLEPYMSVNPQCYVQEINDRLGLNSRLHLKDLHSVSDVTRNNNNNNKDLTQQFWDDGAALPKEVINNSKKDMCQ
jgi:hypothetical protein